jgi:hypothetical protein
MIYFKTHLLALAAACAAGLCIHTSALAGQSCSDKPLSIESLRLGTNTAINVQRALDASKAQVAMVARVGMDLSEYNIRYTHAGLVYREKPSEPWRIAHLLNGCGTAVSDLWHEGLGNFFLDDLHSYEAILMLPPNADIEQRLLKALTSANTMRAVHNSAYSMVAYPFSLKYQNSNDWVLETLAVALSTDAVITNRTQAQAWLKLAGYEPSEMRITAGKRLGARMFKANIAFDDHPNELRFADRIQTVTVDSLVNFLEKRPAKWKKTVVAQSVPAAAQAPAARQAVAATPTATAPPAPQRAAEPALTTDETREASAIALMMMAQMCMGGYPETRPAILKRFRQDIEKVAGKDTAARLLDARFEEGLKELLSSDKPKTVFFSDPPYPICTSYSPETILATDDEKERNLSKANERMHYAHEVLEQCKKRYPGRTLGATQDRQKEIDSYYGPRRGATEFTGSYGHADWLRGSVKNPESVKAKIAEQIKQHGESGWQARCKPS